MLQKFRVIVFFAVLLGLTGCAGLGNMKEVEFQAEAKPDVAMVNIVRRAVFLGDGAKVEAWDGDEFIGTLSAGKLLQYEAKPGIHTFMVYIQGAWGVAKGDLKPGKTYYLKFNMSGWGPISLGVAESTDPRIPEWNTMSTVSIDKSSPKDVPEQYVLKAKKVLQRVESGSANVTPITDRNAL
ncbi:hypothetical protein [Agarivorans gilvus]|uniref:DUF2846 domain-containing protein n=1 Tax=Agarivorans gilvus TaxID=680279 RepID=A0ABQ1HX10_9ALTE|nr:hypothetical protein [Agarivorans gilvus]GGA95672.1 hypothetical protein GCM10007414_05630 [Agarivorans gilvus]